MNEIINTFFLDRFMLEMYLREPGFTYSTCGPITKDKKRIQQLKEQEIHNIFIETN